jgi:hypothetical protein
VITVSYDADRGYSVVSETDEYADIVDDGPRPPRSERPPRERPRPEENVESADAGAAA